MRVIQSTILASAVRTTLQDVEFNTNGADYIVIDLDWTSDGGDTITPAIHQFDHLSETYDAVLTGAGLTAVGHYIYQYGPDLVAVTNLTAQGMPKPIMRFHMAVGGSNNQTYSVGLTLFYRS